MKPVIVMAGTPVDTQMGVDCLTAHGLTGLFCPVSTDPNQQTAFQISSMEEKVAAVTALLRSAQAAKGPLSTAIPSPAPWTSAPLPGRQG